MVKKILPTSSELARLAIAPKIREEKSEDTLFFRTCYFPFLKKWKSSNRSGGQNDVNGYIFGDLSFERRHCREKSTFQLFN